MTDETSQELLEKLVKGIKLVYSLKCEFCSEQFENELKEKVHKMYKIHLENDCKPIKHIREMEAKGFTRKEIIAIAKIGAGK